MPSKQPEETEVQMRTFYVTMVRLIYHTNRSGFPRRIKSVVEVEIMCPKAEIAIERAEQSMPGWDVAECHEYSKLKYR